MKTIATMTTMMMMIPSGWRLASIRPCKACRKQTSHRHVREPPRSRNASPTMSAKKRHRPTAHAATCPCPCPGSTRPSTATPSSVRPEPQGRDLDDGAADSRLRHCGGLEPGRRTSEECQPQRSSGRESVAKAYACLGEARGHDARQLEACWPWDR